MTESLGQRTFGQKEELIFLGREISEQRDYGEEIASQIDREIKVLIDRAYRRAKEVLETHRDQAGAIANRLIEKETLDAPELTGHRHASERPSTDGAEHVRRTILRRKAEYLSLGLFLPEGNGHGSIHAATWRPASARSSCPGRAHGRRWGSGAAAGLADALRWSPSWKVRRWLPCDPLLPAGLADGGHPFGCAPPAATPWAAGSRPRRSLSRSTGASLCFASRPLTRQARLVEGDPRALCRRGRPASCADRSARRSGRSTARRPLESAQRQGAEHGRGRGLG